ncbi:MAG: VWA domain-containing protein [Phycisphaerales bacterium]|nr:VWA domain-containing protein [Phycisphaerales bacterium]
MFPSPSTRISCGTWLHALAANTSERPTQQACSRSRNRSTRSRRRPPNNDSLSSSLNLPCSHHDSVEPGSLRSWSGYLSCLGRSWCSLEPATGVPTERPDAHMTIDFNNLAALHWLWLLLGVTVLCAIAVAARRRAIRRLVDAVLIPRVAPTHSTWRPACRAALVVLAMTAVVAALADPRWGTRSEEVRRSGVDIMFVVDVSRSMLAEDVAPNRLERAKLFIDDAVHEMGGDRVGLVDFAGDAALRTPLTLNYAALMQSVAGLEPKDAARGGSMLGDAITRAAQSFPSDATQGRAIVVLTDGEDMGSDPAAAATEAFNDEGIRVITVGIGDSRDGGRIPVDRGGERTWQLHDGQEVWSRMDPTVLSEVAKAGGGIYVGAGTAHIDLAGVLSGALADLDRGQFETSTVVRTIPRYEWPVAIALLLLVGECLISDRRTVRTQAVIPGGAT